MRSLPLHTNAAKYCLQVVSLYSAKGKRGLTASQLEALLSLKDKQAVCEGRVLRLQPLLSLFFSF